MSSGAAKRPAPGDAGGGAPPAAKRSAGGSSAAPAFLDDDDGDDEDMPWMDDAVDAELAELQGSTDGVRAHWLRPALPPLEPSGDAVGETSFPSHAFVCCVSHLRGRLLRLLRRVSADGHRHHRRPSARGVDARCTAAGGNHPHVWRHRCRCAYAAQVLLPHIAHAAVPRLAGNSVCCHIHGFQPYFYAAMPSNFAPDDVEAFRKVLNVRSFVCSCMCGIAEFALCCQDRTNDATSGRQKQPVYVTRVDVVQKQTLWNYQVRSSVMAPSLDRRLF